MYVDVTPDKDDYMTFTIAANFVWFYACTMSIICTNYRGLRPVTWSLTFDYDLFTLLMETYVDTGGQFYTIVMNLKAFYDNIMALYEAIFGAMKDLGGDIELGISELIQ
jgi:hypothetical protein